MDIISGVKTCESCGSTMRVTFNTCPRCGYFHGKELDIDAINQEYKRKTKKEKVENQGPQLGYSNLRSG